MSLSCSRYKACISKSDIWSDPTSATEQSVRGWLYTSCVSNQTSRMMNRPHILQISPTGTITLNNANCFDLSSSGKHDLPLTFFQVTKISQSTEYVTFPPLLLFTKNCPVRPNLNFPSIQKRPGAKWAGLRKDQRTCCTSMHTQISLSLSLTHTLFLVVRPFTHLKALKNDTSPCQLLFYFLCKGLTKKLGCIACPVFSSLSFLALSLFSYRYVCLLKVTHRFTFPFVTESVKTQ